MNPEISTTWFAPRNRGFALLIMLAAAICWRFLLVPLKEAFSNESYSHILLAIPISLALLYFEREKIFDKVGYYRPAAFALATLAVLFLFVTRYLPPLSLNDSLSVRIFFFVSWTVAAFVLCYGVPAFRAATFPLLFLFLLVPIPDFLLDRTIWLLQRSSTDVAFLMMKAANVPVLRHDIILSLPGVDIEVAKECSGIRSSIMLFVVALVFGHLFLKTTRTKIILALSVLPITVAKNGLRIFVLSTLGIYVDPSFLNGDLHHHGGIVFFMIGMGVLILVIWRLGKSERRPARQEPSRPVDPAESPAL